MHPPRISLVFADFVAFAHFVAFADMMRVKGLGGRKLATQWKTAKIDNIEDLLKACKANRLSKIAGLGPKTEQNIIAAIDAINSNTDRFHYADIADIARNLVICLQKLFATALISLCGETRRQTMIVQQIEMLTTVAAAKFKGTSLNKINEHLIHGQIKNDGTYA